MPSRRPAARLGSRSATTGLAYTGLLSLVGESRLVLWRWIPIGE